jgi:hypothetical protein
MLVYGDAESRARAEDKRASVLERWRAVGRFAPGLGRHAAIVAAFMELSELVQGLADAAFEADERDDVGSAADPGMALLTELARAVYCSWRTGFGDDACLPQDFESRLLRLDHPNALRCRKAEGYAYYGLYPESYAEAASRSGLGPDTRIIGIRSIGTGLSAMVAAVLGAEPPVTRRPVGHPFRREVRMAPELARELLRVPAASFAVVDEGPGLSGSSFGAVADWLEAGGVDRARIHFFPSHRGDLGPQASPAHRERWSRGARHSVDVDELILSSRRHAHRLESWAAECTGEPIESKEDLSAGEWRRLNYASESDWPASNVQQERRKLLLRTRSGRWLAKFVGLGGHGERVFDQSKRLARAGFAPAVAGFCHGFIIHPWYDAALLDPDGFGRSRLVERIAAYLAFRAQAIPAEGAHGASLDDLFAMAAHNAGEALGPKAMKAVRNLGQKGRRLECCVRRIRTDNRMHLWEWLHLPDGRLLKTDGVDHNAAHDLIGCQDVAWDVAGAAVELGLADDEAESLRAAVEQAGSAVERDLVEALTPCYLAFQLGASTMASQSAGAQEAVRLKGAAMRYGQLLAGRLGEEAFPAVPL